MKTLVLTAALVVLTAVSFSQKVSENGQEMKSDLTKVKVAMYSNVSDQVTFIVMKQPEDKLNLKIKDEKGSLVYEKRLRKPENRKITFDIKSLPEGKYTFELAKGKEVLYTNSISKGAASIAFSK
jgi:flagellar hook assembly protein FlgD